MRDERSERTHTKNPTPGYGPFLSGRQEGARARGPTEGEEGDGSTRLLSPDAWSGRRDHSEARAFSLHFSIPSILHFPFHSSSRPPPLSLLSINSRKTLIYLILTLKQI